MFVSGDGEPTPEHHPGGCEDRFDKILIPPEDLRADDGIPPPPPEHSEPRVAARPGDRIVEFFGRAFAESHDRSILAGHSLRCVTCGFAKNIRWVPSGKLSQDEALQRLLRWETACPGDPQAHKALGGVLLKDFKSLGS